MKILIGIDPGTTTGFAVWRPGEKRFSRITGMKILEAMGMIMIWLKGSDGIKHKIHLVIEDARQVRFRTTPNKAQGAGSVKRDCYIWEEFCKGWENAYPLTYEFVRPNKKITKLSKENFQTITGYQGRTNQHGRDAAMLVFQKNFPKNQKA